MRFCQRALCVLSEVVSYRNRPKAQLRESIGPVGGRFLALATVILTLSAIPAVADQFELSGKFSVSSGGAATYSMPIAVPPGTNGMAPSLSLQYSSQQANGVLGLGWTLEGLPTITRCPQTVAQDGAYGTVNYDMNDRFCLDGQRLMVVSGTYGADGATYRTERDNYSKVISHGTAGNGPAWFEVHTKAGLEMDFGNAPDGTATQQPMSQLPVKGSATIRVWELGEQSDTAGNYYVVSYAADTANGVDHVSRIDYTGNTAASLATYASVRFTYTTRTDIVPFYRAGALVKETKLISDITTYNGSTLVSDYSLAYQNRPSTGRSELISVTLTDAAGNTLPATTFTWEGTSTVLGGTSINESPVTFPNIITSSLVATCFVTGNFSGSGRPDILVATNSNNSTPSGLYFAQEDGTYVRQTSFTGTVPCPMTTGDWNGDGITDIAVQGASSDPNTLGPVNFYSVSATGLTLLWSHNFYNDFNSLYSIIPGNFDGSGKVGFLALPVGTVITCPNPNNPCPAHANIYLPSGSSISCGSFFCKLPNFGPTWQNNKVIVADFDGDGRADLMINGQYVYLAKDFLNETVVTSTTPSFINSCALTDGTYLVGDFNGDGKTDIGTDTGTICLSTGAGFVATATPANWNVQGAQVADFNGDGMSDLLAGDATTGTLTLWTATPSPTGLTFVPTALTGDIPTILGDTAGKGAPDIMFLSNPTVVRPTAFTPDLITNFTSGLGARTVVSYSPMDRAAVYTEGSSATYPTQDTNGSMYLVSLAQTNSGTKDANGSWVYYKTEYDYAGAQSDLQGRGFLGFGSTIATDDQTQIVSTTNYNLGWPLTGYVSEAKKTYGYFTLSDTVDSYSTRQPGGVFQVLLSAATTTGNDLHNYATPIYQTADTYDNCGNLKTTSLWSNKGSTKPTSNLTTNTWSLPNAVNIDCFTDKNTEVVQTNTTTEAATATQTTTYAYDSVTGLPSVTNVEPGDATMNVRTVNTRDGFGNIIQTSLYASNFVGRGTTFTYDTKGRFLLSQAVAPLSVDLVTSYTRDGNFGGLLSQTDPDGQTTSWSYDTFGRKTNETRPDGTQTNWTYTSATGCPYATSCTVKAVSTGQPTVTTVYDILERQLSTRQPSFDGTTTIISNDTTYDALGHVSSVSRPYFATGSAQPTTYTYDPLGEVLTETHPDGGVITTVHEHYLSLGVTQATLSGPGFTSETSTTVTNSLNQVIQKQEVLNSTTTLVTAYTYEPFGNMNQETDPAGNVVTMTWDVRGHKLAQTDPDTGAWSYSYNGLGWLLSRTDAVPGTVNYTYDIVGRPLTVTGAISPQSTWTYDPTGCKGHLATASTDTGYSRTEFYDSVCRDYQTSTNVDSGNYVTTSVYDSAGRVIDIWYPGPEGTVVVARHYNAHGYLSSITDTSNNVLWAANTEDASLNVTQETFGHNATIPIVSTRTFDPETGFITQVYPEANGAFVRQLNYTWDVAGNVSTRHDYGHGTETFSYDPLNRVTGVTFSSSSLTAKVYAYDGIGNITCKSDLGACSATSPNYVYGTGAAGPHAVTKITGITNSGSASVTNPGYSYDADGRLIGGTGGRIYTYNGFEAPLTVHNSAGTSTFTYDSEHNRSKQIENLAGTANDNTTIYVNAQGVRTEVYTLNGTTTYRSYVTVGDRIVDLLQTSGISLTSNTYFITDGLGSTLTLLDDTSAIIEQDSYDVWGKRRNLNFSDDPGDTVTSATIRGFTGQEHMDDFGLINYNARMYDPQIGRFGGPDPIVGAPYLGQGWNRYAYVLNNPLNQIDPTGKTCTPGATDGEMIVCSGVPNSTDDGGSSLGVGGVTAGIQVAVNLSNNTPNGSSTGSGSGAQAPNEGGKSNNTPPENKGQSQKTSDNKDGSSPAGKKVVRFRIQLDNGDIVDVSLAEFADYCKSGCIATLSSSKDIDAALRDAYKSEIANLGNVEQQMRAEGKSPEEIGRTLSQMRRDIGESVKNLTSQVEFQRIIDRNMKLYNDPLGPTVDFLREQGKSWEDIIQSAQRTGGQDLGYK